jgi:hypothetical protein
MSHPTDSDLPSSAALVDAPQLSSLALLQVALRVVPRDLDLHDSNVRPLCDLVLDDYPNSTAAILAQLIIDRCRELSELASAYRTALCRSHGRLADEPFDDCGDF